MKCFITRTENGVAICQANDDDVITHELPVGDDPSANLFEVADEHGWQAIEGEPEDADLIYLEPVPTPVRFVGEVVPEDALDLVRQNGLENATAVVGTEPIEGGIIALVMTTTPVDWEWGNPTAFG